MTNEAGARATRATHPLHSAIASRVVRSCARLTPWVESELLGLRQLVGRGDVCIDIGAAVELYTAELSQLVGEAGVVHSVEPLDFLYPAARMLRLRRAANVRCHAVALGEAAGRHPLSVPMRRGRPVPGRSYLALGSTGAGSNAEFREHLEVSVPTGTLTGFAQRVGVDRVDLIKADVEGAEFGLLRGGRQVLVEYGPRLLLEIEQRHMTRFGHGPDSVVAWLAGLGYRLFIWRRGGWREVDQVTEACRNYLCSINEPTGDRSVSRTVVVPERLL